MLLRCLCLLLCLLPQGALAGAWPMAEGSSQAIATSSRKAETPAGVIGQDGETARSEVSFFAEHGLTADTTLGLVISGGYADGSLARLPDEIDAELSIGGHVRHRIWQGEDGNVASVQLGASFPAERWLGNRLGDNRPGSVSEAYVQLLYGHSWQLSWSNVFVSTGLEFRARGEGQDEEVKLSASGGVQPHDRVLGLLDVIWSEPLGELGQPSLKLTPSVAFVLRPWLGANDKKPQLKTAPTTMQFGVTWDAYAPSDGISLNISIWRSF